RSFMSRLPRVMTLVPGGLNRKAARASPMPMGPEPLVLQGRFKVLRHIGGGGMSEVYLAVQLSLGRQVALKVLKRDLGKRPDMAERFRREALLLSTVDHPAVVRVIDFEPTPEATVLVLELAEGDTLET